MFIVHYDAAWRWNRIASEEAAALAFEKESDTREASFAKAKTMVGSPRLGEEEGSEFYAAVPFAFLAAFLRRFTVDALINLGTSFF